MSEFGLLDVLSISTKADLIAQERKEREQSYALSLYKSMLEARKLELAIKKLEEEKDETIDPYRQAQIEKLKVETTLKERELEGYVDPLQKARIGSEEALSALRKGKLTVLKKEKITEKEIPSILKKGSQIQKLFETLPIDEVGKELINAGFSKEQTINLMEKYKLEKDNERIKNEIKKKEDERKKIKEDGEIRFKVFKEILENLKIKTKDVDEWVYTYNYKDLDRLKQTIGNLPKKYKIMATILIKKLEKEAKPIDYQIKDILDKDETSFFKYKR